MNGNRGFTLVEILIVVVIIGILAGIAVPGYGEYRKKAKYAALVSECRNLYMGFMLYEHDNGEFPDEAGGTPFSLDTFAPLRGDKYYQGDLEKRVLNGRADGYSAPDDISQNKEFWIEFTFLDDPSIRILITQSDNAPLAAGQKLNGVFVSRGGGALTTP